jgi:shikimate dehydrogenase
MKITAKTKVCALLGDPVEHSMSPAMHNAAFKEMGLDFVYLPFLVKPEHLTSAVAGLRALNVRGFNVTLPHKVAVIPLLDNLDPLAAKIGAVNTVVNTGGRLQGFNTDAEGFYRALEEHGVNPEGKQVAVLGAGGAGRAVSYILTEKGARVTVFNRREHLDRAQNIADMINKSLGQPVPVTALENLAAGLRGTDILVNTTSIGMWPNEGDTLVPAALLKDIPVVFDVVYNPVATRLLTEAGHAGAKTIGGADMLTWQGALAFEKWTGRPAPLDLMRRQILKTLAKKAVADN